jgi:hypothetical protein
MPTILNTKQASSFFEDKVDALQKFGFIEKRPNDLLYLTDLAMQIIDPVSGEDHPEEVPQMPGMRSPELGDGTDEAVTAPCPGTVCCALAGL